MLIDSTNETITLSMERGTTLSVDIDQDSSVSRDQWIWLFVNDEENEPAFKLTLSEAGLLHDRLGRLLGRPGVANILETRIATIIARHQPVDVYDPQDAETITICGECQEITGGDICTTVAILTGETA